VQCHQFRTDDIADFLRRHFGVAGAGTVKKTNVHRENVSILAVTLRLVYQKGRASLQLELFRV
jgi:hypothetical protein